ncbi:hypothetical protein MTO96_016520 [Rhipicephalus appendiculatus]
MLPQRVQESRTEALDALEVEFAKLQASTIPTDILNEGRADAQWTAISQLKGPDGLLKFSRIAEVMLGILSIPHSNAECERQFSIVKKTRTQFRSSMCDKTLANVLLAKCQRNGFCYGQTYSDDFLKKAKSAATKALQK